MPIDDKVVAMSFESSRFQSGISEALSAIDKLKAGLKFDGATKGLQDIDAAGKKIDLSHIGKGVDEIRGKLDALSVAAIAVFTNIAMKAVSAGENMIKALTLTPLTQGFSEYQTNLNSIQTILSNTAAAGTTLKDVTDALDELNRYSDKTIYNFGQMAKNIGTFTAAGVDLDTSVNAIKGIANLAAFSGSNADQASTAMYQLSQAISSGTVMARDWISVTNAGMGGAVFQRALAQTAVAMGTLKESTLKLTGPMKTVTIAGNSFRDSLSAPVTKGWLSSKVLTNTLAQFTGDLSDAALAAQGFTGMQIEAIQKTAKAAQLAATQVKDIKTVFSVAQETAGSGWAETFKIVFGNFNEAKKTFTDLSNAVNGIINRSAAARNKVLGDWKALGGRTVLINAIKTAFENLSMILKPVKEAFREIFPAKTGEDLNRLTYEFKHLAEALKPSPATVENLKRTFAGFFAILDIGKQIIGGVFTVFGKLFGSVHQGSGGFLSFTANIGDFLVAIDKALKEGGRLHNFFAGLGTILAAPLKLLGAIGHVLSGLFSGFSSGGFLGQMDGMAQAMSPLQKVVTAVSGLFAKLIDDITNSGPVLQPIFDAIINFITDLGNAIGQGAAGMDFSAILAGIQTGLLGGLFVIFKNFTHQLTGGFFGGGIIKNISSTFQSLSNSMQAMQHNIQAKTLKEIAIAIALLVASVVALSFVDPEKLKKAVVAMGFVFGELLAAMKIMDQVTKGAGFIKLPFIAASLILLAAAIDLLTISVIALSLLSWDSLLKGLTGVGALLVIVSAASIPLSANSAGMIRAGIGITAMAVGLRIMASAVAAFAQMSWGEMLKGLSGVAISLVAIAAAMQLMPKGMVLQSAGLILVATALKILAGVVMTFGTMNWDVMRKGLTGLGGALIVIGAALQLMPKNMIFIALGLWGVTAALIGIADVVKSFGGMSMKEMAKGMIGLAGSLIILAGALYLMSGTLAGATALAVAAAGVSLLAPALKTLGSMSWGDIVKGLAGLAGALGILVIAGALVTPMVPALLGLGVALVLMGGGLALAGAGIALIGIGLSALVVAAPTGIGILIAALEELMAAIPKLAEQMITGFLSIVNMLAATAPKFVDAIVKILGSLLDAIIQSSPKIAEAFNALIALALKVLRDNQAKIIQAGFNLILGLLQGIKNNVGAIVTSVADIIAKILSSIAGNLGKIIAAGVTIVVSLIKGIANSYATIITAAVTVVTKFLGAIANNVGLIVTAGVNILVKFLQGISNNIGRVITLGTDIIVKFITGIGNAGKRVIDAGTNTIIKLINSLSKNSVKLADAGMKAIIKFLNGMATAIDNNAPKMRAAGLRVAEAIINGMTGGLIGKAHEVYDKISEIMGHAMSLMHKIPGVHSPSTVTYEIGLAIGQGLANGIAASSLQVFTAADDLSKAVLKKFEDIFVTPSTNPMTNIAEFLTHGFTDGITGSTDDVISSFTDLNSKINDAMTTARANIKTQMDKQDAILASKKPDVKAFLAAQKIIDENEAVLKKATEAHRILVGTLKAEGVELLKVTMQYDVVTEKLKKATDALDAAIQLRDSAAKSLAEQYSKAPDISGPATEEIKNFRDTIASENEKLNKLLAADTPDVEAIAAARASVVTETAKLNDFLQNKVLDSSGNSIDLVATYLEALKTQGDAVGAYSATLDQLRALGLDDATYQKLLTEGTADQSFADQLLAGGKTAVDSLNTLDSQLATVSGTLAVNAANNLYQAGVDAAQGLVKGLTSQQSELYALMESIGRKMVAAMRKAIKAKSPSQAFSEIGTFAMEGLAQGFTNSSKLVTDAVDIAAKNALTKMKESMRDISNAVTDELNPSPVITPILDLSQVRTQTQELAALTSTTPITASASFAQAAIISASQGTGQAEDTAAASGGTTVKFEQNNYSPEALTEIEIYRQTRNQLSQLKSVLAT